MTIALSRLRDCFEGVIPSVIATSDSEGVPNASYLSQLFQVDDQRVALSNQFFSKTAANVRATGRATLLAVDGRTGAQYRLQLAFEEALTGGDLFARMSAHLDAISSQHGMRHVMALKSADIYRVEAIDVVPQPVEPDTGGIDRAEPAEHFAAAARLSGAIAASVDPDSMLDDALVRLSQELGFTHVIVLAKDPAADKLATLASRGYTTTGAGAEVALGDGVIGIAAATRQPVRICDMSRGRRMAEAVRAEALRADLPLEQLQRSIPLPGLAGPHSQLAVPMLVGNMLMGVLFTESEERFAFTREDEDMLIMIGAQIAAALRLGELADRDLVPRISAASTASAGEQAALDVRYYPFDDSVFIDDAYIIKGVPGRLLFHFLKQRVEHGRADFTNREIRLDSSLRLPDFKDNLETRLILLRRRLEEKQAGVRLLRPERGRIRLELTGTPKLTVMEQC